MIFSTCEEKVMETLFAKVDGSNLKVDLEGRCIGTMQEINPKVAKCDHVFGIVPHKEDGCVEKMQLEDTIDDVMLEVFYNMTVNFITGTNHEGCRKL